MKITDSHTHYMHYALRLAARMLGQTWPNPTVGAVIVKNNIILGAGATAHGGRPHAETMALEQAGAAADGATLYVTLEPCAHIGKTPPCAQTIIKAGIKHVVAACIDPNPKVAGKGFEQLQKADIAITQGVCEKEALEINKGFFSVMERGRPWITLKVATSMDGKMADSQGKSKWITNALSRAQGHLLRASYDAILTGMGTVKADDPMLTCRIPGRENHSPQRIVVDRGLDISPEAKILPAWIFTSEGALKSHAKKAAQLEKKGAEILASALNGNHLSLKAIVETLTQKGVTRLLVESGSMLATAMVKQDMVDEIYWFRAPMVIGEHGLSALKGGDFSLKDAPQYMLRAHEKLENDILEIYERSPL